MKVAHNIRFEAFSKSEDERDALEERLRDWLALSDTIAFEREDLTHERFDTIYATKLWLDKQRIVTATLNRLVEDMPAADRQALLKEAPAHLDERENFHFRLDKAAFLAGDVRFALRGDVIQVRVNFAAFPKTPEQVLAVAESVLSPTR